MGDGDGDEASGQQRGQVRVARVMATVMRVVGDEEAMTTAARAIAIKTMVAGEGDGDGDSDKGGRGWRATKRALAMAARAMAMATRLEGKQQHPG